jgi:hypothetical protein
MASADTANRDPDTAKSDPDIAKRDELKKRAGIGKGISDSLVRRANEELERVPVKENYRRRFKEAFPFEALETRDVTKEVVDSWLEVWPTLRHVFNDTNVQKNRDNVQRVVNRLGKEVTDEGPDLLDSWAAIRIKQLPKPGRLSGFSNKTQIVVLIALNKWNKENGFFLSDVAMESGEDIILNGGDEIVFPGPGGGLVIIFYLQSSS